MSENVKLQIKLGEKEYVAAVRAFLLRDYGIVKGLSGMILLASYIFIWLMLMNVELWIALMPVLMILFPYISALYIQGPKKRFRSDPTLREEFEIEFSDEGVLYKGLSSIARVNWEYYSRVVETKQVYVLVRGKFQITVIPKDVFDSASQEATFRRLLRKHFSPDALRNLKPSDARREIEEYVPPPTPPDWR